VGEMSGCSVVEAVLAGAGDVSSCARELHRIEQAFADPEHI